MLCSRKYNIQSPHCITENPHIWTLDDVTLDDVTLGDVAFRHYGYECQDEQTIPGLLL